MAKIKTVNEDVKDAAEEKKIAEAKAAEENETKVVAALINQHRTAVAMANVAFEECKGMGENPTLFDFYIKRRKWEIGNELVDIIARELGSHNVGINDKGEYFTTRTEMINLNENGK